MLPGDVSFGPFKFDPRTGRLTKRGYRIKLQPKAAAALSCLLERTGEVVPRARLQASLWPEGTHIDFDMGIKVAVKKLRDALSDDSEEPVYIQTVHGEGYRFIAPVESVVVAAHSSSTPGLPVAAAPPSHRRRMLWWAACIAAASALLAIPYARSPRTNPMHFQNRDWVVIAAFENRTGEKLLNGTMEFALERSLSQSSYVNVAPRDRINDALRLMRQSPSAILTEDLARQIAVRDGAVKAVLAGRVEKFGPKYVLTVRVLNPARGDTAAVFEKEGTAAQLPDSARQISDELRLKLGEQAFSGNMPLEKATTPSLAALRAFSTGIARVDEHNFGKAAPLFEEAILDDPDFASAHIYAANCYANLGQAEKAAPHYETAFRLAPGVSQRERLFILGSYYARATHDDRKAIDAYQTLVNLYPDDYRAVNNLSNAYSRLGMQPQYVETIERLVALRPNDPNFGQLEVLWYFYRFERPDRAKATHFRDTIRRLRGASDLAPGTTWGPVDVKLDLEAATDFWLSGDVKAAAREVARVSSNALASDDSTYTTVSSEANLALGKLSAAKDLCGHLGDPIVHSECLLRIAFATGDRNFGMEQWTKIRNSKPSNGRAFIDICLGAWLGDTTIAAKWAKYRSDGNTAAWALLAKGRFAQAAELFAPQPVTPYSYPWNRYPMALALEHLGKPEEAIVRLEEENLPHNCINLGFTWPLCRTKLASLYRKVGRLDDAQKVEDQLRHYLSEADPNYPILKQLRD